MKGLVLSGGHGTRLRPLTYGFAKQLIPIANKPVLFYSLEDIKNSGIEEVVLNVAPHSRSEVMQAVGDGSRFGLKASYNLQEEPLGIAHAVKIARRLLGDEPFVVYLGDNILKNGIRSYVERFANSEMDAATLVSRVPNPEKFGTVEVEGNRVKRLVEKPKVPTSQLAMVGVYLLKASIFESLERIKPSGRGELEIVDAYQDLIEHGGVVEAMEVDGWWADTGTAEGLLEANRTILDDLKPYNHGKLENNAAVEGKVGIGKGTVVHGNSRIRGPSIIGENCEIGPDVYVGPYTSVGSNSKVISGELENSIVMEGASIQVDARISDSLMGKDVVIERRKYPSGMRLIIGEKSVIGL